MTPVAVATTNDLIRLQLRKAAARPSLSEMLKARAAEASRPKAEAKPARLGRDPEEVAREDRGRRRSEIMARIERLKKELDLVKKVWAHDLKGLARQLGRLAQELRDAAKAYAAIVKEAGAGGAAPAINAALATVAPQPAGQVQDEAVADDGAEPPPDDGGTSAGSEGAASSAPGDDAAPETAERLPAPEARAAAAYGAEAPRIRREVVRLDQSPEALEAKIDKDNLAHLKGLAKKIREEFDYARKRAIVSLPGEGEKSEAFVETEKVLKALDKELDDIGRDVAANTPIAGFVTTVVA